MMEFPEARLLIFAKAPIPGQVKTRLVNQLSRQGAAKLYKMLLRQTLHRATAVPLCPVQLWCSPSVRHGFFLACRRDYRVTLRTQQGKDLGHRMDHALTDALEESPYAILIGGDCASLGLDELRFALQTLASGKDAVLGPAEDGGYVLIGLCRPCRALFQGITWSGRQVAAATRQRLQQNNLDWAELPLGWDVDHPADVRRLRRQQASSTSSLNIHNP